LAVLTASFTGMSAGSFFTRTFFTFPFTILGSICVFFAFLKAFSVAGGDGTAPIQLLGDLFDGVSKHEPSAVEPTYTGKVALRNAADVFPKFIIDSLSLGCKSFEREISGFSDRNAVLTFPETRTSSPVRIPRNEIYLANGCLNLFPCGEGAGYAGGITSAAVDGLRAAMSFINNL